MVWYNVQYCSKPSEERLITGKMTVGTIGERVGKTINVEAKRPEY